MKNFRFILVMAMIVVLVVAGVITVLKITKNSNLVVRPESSFNIGVECEKRGGTWLAEYEECENISRESCDLADGVFYECESACRHEFAREGETIPCTTQCVPVCRLGKLKTPIGPNPANASYVINNEIFTLVDGESIKEIVPGAATKIETKMLDETKTADVNGDYQDDAVVILVQDTGGSGLFYYAAVAVNVGNGYQGSKAVLLGDRINFKALEINRSFINLGYLDHVLGEDMAAVPTNQSGKFLLFKDNELQELKIKNEFLEVNSPGILNQIISPVIITGRANFPEGKVRIRIKDERGNVLADVTAMARGYGERLYPFSEKLEYAKSTAEQGLIEIFAKAEDGAEINKVVIPVIFRDFDQKEKAIGGERDSYDCLVTAGYAWNETAQACIRSWELDEAERQLARLAVERIGDDFKGITIMKVEAEKNCEDCYSVLLQINGVERMRVRIKNNKVVSLEPAN